jgi:nitrous oxide reductase accessory protein NosL
MPRWPTSALRSKAFALKSLQSAAVFFVSDMTRAAWERRVEGVIDAKTGFKAFFISRDDLIAAKLASGRTRDLADVEDIRKAAESQRPEAKKPPDPNGPK